MFKKYMFCNKGIELMNLNCKETVRSSIVDNEISFRASPRTCDYERSSFRDKNHGHIIIGDFRLMVNTTLRSRTTY